MGCCHRRINRFTDQEAEVAVDRSNSAQRPRRNGETGFMLQCSEAVKRGRREDEQLRPKTENEGKTGEK